MPPVSGGMDVYTAYVSGWVDVLRPYLKSTAVFQCPSDVSATSGSPAMSGYTDYFYNARLGKLGLGKISHPQLTISAGDGGGAASDARYALSDLQAGWRTTVDAPALRHISPGSTSGRGANYLFADGHVKWISPARILSASPVGGNYTFLFK